MEVSNILKSRWVLTDVDNLTYGHAKYLARRYNVRVAEVVNVAIEHLVEFLADGGQLPDGWADEPQW